MTIRANGSTIERASAIDACLIGDIIHSPAVACKNQNLASPLLTLAAMSCEALDARKQSWTDPYAKDAKRTVHDLNVQLEEWRQSLRQPVRIIYDSNVPFPDSNFSQIFLQMCYFQTLWLINRPRATNEYYVELLNEHESARDAQGLSTPDICIEAARESIRLIMDIPAEFGSFFQCVSRNK